MGTRNSVSNCVLRAIPQFEHFRAAQKWANETSPICIIHVHSLGDHSRFHVQMTHSPNGAQRTIMRKHLHSCAKTVSPSTAESVVHSHWHRVKLRVALIAFFGEISDKLSSSENSIVTDHLGVGHLGLGTDSQPESMRHFSLNCCHDLPRGREAIRAIQTSDTDLEARANYPQRSSFNAHHA